MTDDDIRPKAEAAIRHDGQTLATQVLARAQHDPTIALGILGVAVDAVLATVPNHDERAALLTEFIEALTTEAEPGA